MKPVITEVTAKVVETSRGTHTIGVTVHSNEFSGTFTVPEGASTGSFEVHAIDAYEACNIITQVIAPRLCGVAVTQQNEIDALLHSIDTSVHFQTIGGNVALGVSVAAAKAAAAVERLQTWQYIAMLFDNKKQATAPRLFINLINGGKHAPQGSQLQEHQIIPDTDDVEEAYNVACLVQQSLQDVLTNAYGTESIGKGDEGGFTIPSASAFEPFGHIRKAIRNTHASIPVYLSTDVAASSFFKEGRYELEDQLKDDSAMFDFYATLHTAFPELIAVEDPFFETAFESFAKYRSTYPEVMVLGDDLTTTNITLLQTAIDHQAINAMIIKPNQIGTLTETLATMSLAYSNNIRCIVSHRSGETMDDFIADLAFGTHCYGFKAGAPKALEREAKYQRLIHIQKNA